MVVDLELTLNRFGFYKPAINKIQIGPLRISWWAGMKKVALSFEINWKTQNGAGTFGQCPPERKLKLGETLQGS